MPKYKLTTTVRVSTIQAIREHADSERSVGRFLDELVEAAIQQGWLQRPAKEDNTQ